MEMRILKAILYGTDWFTIITVLNFIITVYYKLLSLTYYKRITLLATANLGR